MSRECSCPERSRVIRGREGRRQGRIGERGERDEREGERDRERGPRAKPGIQLVLTYLIIDMNSSLRFDCLCIVVIFRLCHL